MSIKVVRIIIVLLVGILTIAAAAGPTLTDQGVRSYCAAYSSPPYRSGSVVRGTGGLYCTQTVGMLRVVVQVRDWGESGNSIIRQSAAAENTCHNTPYCEATATLSYIGNHYYDTATSGYWGSYSSYHQSNKVYIP
jgi:hypothetical protein